MASNPHVLPERIPLTAAGLGRAFASCRFKCKVEHSIQSLLQREDLDMPARHLRYIARVESTVALLGESRAGRLGIDHLCLLSHVRDPAKVLELATAALKHARSVDELGAEVGAVGPADPLLAAAFAVVCRRGWASVSVVQRALAIGYGHAAKLLDAMEQRQLLGLA